MKGRCFIAVLAVILACSGTMIAQPYLVEGNIEHAGEGSIYLASYFGDRFMIVDSVESNSGSFHFLLSNEDAAGVYRLIYPEEYHGVRSENRFVEFIYMYGNVELNVSLEEHGPLPHFDHSVENQVYLDFMDYQLEYEAALTRVYGEIYPASPGNADYERAVNEYEALQRGRHSFMDSLGGLYPGLYATRIMNAFRAPVVSGRISHSERIDSLKRYFFEEASIDDPTLLHAPVYTFRIVDYLSLYKDVSLDRQQQEQQFIEAADQIMANVAPIQELRNFVVDFLLEGFELLGMEEVQVHLADHYLDESCESEVAGMVKDRMEGYRKMSVGERAPDFTIRGLSGKNYTLSAIPNPYTLVMFWASTCGHCRVLIPELKKWYLEENELDVELVAISIDSSVVLFNEYTREEDFPWPTSHDPLGWHGKVAGDYHIYATPSLFLLDREQVILARPVSFRQLERSLRKLQ